MNGLPRDGIDVVDDLKDNLVGTIDIPPLPGVFEAYRMDQISLDCLLRTTSKLLWRFRDGPRTYAHKQYCDALVWARTDVSDISILVTQEIELSFRATTRLLPMTSQVTTTMTSRLHLRSSSTRT